MTENSIETFTLETEEDARKRLGLDAMEYWKIDAKRIVESLMWDYLHEQVGQIVRKELELFFMRRDPLFIKVLREINEGR